jgi:hypothetical protein
LSSIERFSSGVLNTCQGMMLKSRSMSLSFLVRKHGEKAGLLFTDAAHELLDCSSPVLSRSCSVVSRSCSSADPKVSESESDPSLCHVALSVVFLLLIIFLRVKDLGFRLW